MTHDLGEALRDSVDSAVDIPVDAVLLLRGVDRAKARLGRRDRTRALAAVLATATAVAAVALLLPTLRPDASPQPVATSPSVPAGSQAVSWHGVQVFVPERWELNARRCTQASADTVLVPSFVNLCGSPYEPGLTVVEFIGFPRLGPPGLTEQWIAAATQDVDLAGTPARAGSIALTEESGVRRVLVVPSEGVVLTVRSPDPAAADRILATAAVVAVDANGCPSRIPSSRAAGPVDREGASESLLPGTPVGVSACRYEALRLVASRRLDDRVAVLQRRVDALATGVSGRKPEREITEDACQSTDDSVTTFEARYADGEPLRVFFRGQACTDRSASNGSTTRRSDQALLLDLFKLVTGGELVPATDRTPASPQPAPELGYVTADGQGRFDLLARVDSDTAPQLLGIANLAGRRCVVARDPVSGTTWQQSCANENSNWISTAGTVAAKIPSKDVLVGATDSEVRTIKVLINGGHTATWATYGGGAAYEQRRFFLGLLPEHGDRLELVALDSIGTVVSTTTLSR